MSLLMDALKKAEEAKHRTEAQGDADPATPSDSNTQAEREGLDAELELELNQAYLDAVARGPRAHVEPAVVAPTVSPGTAQAGSNPVAAHQRWAARTIFVAKESHGHYRHLVLYSLAAVLAVVTAGVYYVGMKDNRVADVTAPRALAAAAPEPEAAPPVDEQPPDELAPLDDRALRTVLQRPARSAAEEIAPPEGAAPAREPAIVVIRRELTPRVDTLTDDAYAAYRRGDSRTAHSLYWQVLRADANNRNALLGLAAIAARNDEQAQAREFYLRLLDRDPNDPLALAGLLNLEDAADPRAQEIRVKSLLSQHPQAAHLHAALGNLYAREQRWSEAQTAYAQALALDERDALRPEHKNPDFAFNLAVSLEHLGQTAAALHHYRAALSYAQHRRPDFDPTVAQARIRALAVD